MADRRVFLKEQINIKIEAARGDAPRHTSHNLRDVTKIVCLEQHNRKTLIVAYFVEVWKAFDSSAKVSGCKKEFDRLSQLYFLFFILTHVKLR